MIPLKELARSGRIES